MIRILFRGKNSEWQVALSLILFVATFGVLGYMLLAGLSFIDALYQTMSTLTTVGYRDLADEHSHGSPVVKIFTICLLLFGFGVGIYAFSLFMRSLFEGELRDLIGQHRTRRRIHYMKDHFILCGFGRMGELIAGMLEKEQIPFVIIDTDPQRRNDIEQKGYTCLIGDATHDETLIEAHIEKAKALIAVTNSDAENLFITLSARQLSPQLNIVSRALSQEAENKLIRAGANRVILPYKLGALQLAQAALRPNVVDFIEIATRTSKMDIEIEELKVEATSPLVDKSLREAEVLRKLGLIIIGIRSGADEQMQFNPSAQTAIRAGDTLIALGKPEKLAQMDDFIH